jgi:hypothetical protein
MAKKTVDWDAIEPHYRAGIRSLKEIGEEFEVSDAAIIKHAKKKGWTRDLRAKIAARAEAKVSAAAVSAEVSAAKTANQEQIVEANAEAIFRIRMAHRSAAGKFQTLVQEMVKEIEVQTMDPALFAELGDLMNQGLNDKGRADKVAEAYQRVIALPGRVDTMKKLVEAFEKLVKLEREAFGLAAVPDTTPPPPDTTPTNEIARRVAFLLYQGLRAQKG